LLHVQDVTSIASEGKRMVNLKFHDYEQEHYHNTK